MRFHYILLTARREALAFCQRTQKIMDLIEWFIWLGLGSHRSRFRLQHCFDILFIMMTNIH